MIVSNEFVYIHHPKTGGTFVTRMLQEVAKRQKSFRAEEVRGEKHSGANRIPAKHRGKLVVVNVRNVFDHYASRYTFRWWADPEHARNRFDMDRVKRDFPAFPDLTFSDFLSLFNDWSYRNVERGGEKRMRNLDALEIGHNSQILVKMTQTRPMRLLRALDEMTDDELLDHFSHVRFLRTECLNSDLCSLLEEVGVEEEAIEPIRASGRVLPDRGGRGKEESWNQYFSNEDVQYILRRDRMYFRLFPEMLPEEFATESSHSDAVSNA